MGLSAKFLFLMSVMSMYVTVRCVSLLQSTNENLSSTKEILLNEQLRTEVIDSKLHLLY